MLFMPLQLVCKVLMRFPLPGIENKICILLFWVAKFKSIIISEFGKQSKEVLFSFSKHGNET